MYIKFKEETAQRFFDMTYPGDPHNRERVEGFRRSGQMPDWWIDRVNGNRRYHRAFWNRNGELTDIMTGRTDSQGKELTPIDEGVNNLRVLRKEGLAD